MRDAAWSREADREVAPLLDRPSKTGREQGRLHAAASECGQRARAKKPADALASERTRTARHDAVHERQKKAAVAPAVEALHYVEHRLCHWIVFGEALCNGLRPEFRFMGL